MTSLSERTPLRVKLIAAVLALAAVALAVFGVGSVSVLRDYLIARVDGQLNGFTIDVLRKLPRMSVQPVALRIPNDGLVQLRDKTGKIILTKSGPGVESQPGPALSGTEGPRAQNVAATAGGGRWRVRVTVVPDSGTVVTAIDLSAVDQIIGRLVLIELLVGGGVMIAIVGVGVVIVRRSLRPLEEIERTAGEIAAGNLSLRLADRDPRTEMGRLARSLNGMLAQIETAFRDREASEVAARRSEDRMRRFIADASHELRTPLTSIRGFAEYFRQNPGADPARLMARVEAQAARMGMLVDDLLLLARLDQQRPLQTLSVDLLAIAADAVTDAQVLSPDRDVSLSVEGEAALLVTGDDLRLRQVVGNLVNNALTHTPSGTPVMLRVGTKREGSAGTGYVAFIEVSDKGPGLTPEQAERVFERFYRADPSRSRRTSTTVSHSGAEAATSAQMDGKAGLGVGAHISAGGSGLGLSIVAALVKAHGGTVSVETAPGAGATFRVVLPLSPEALG